MTPDAHLRCLAHEGNPGHLAPPSSHDREAVWPRWRASVDRGESPAQAATHRPAPCSPAGAEAGGSDRLICGLGSLFLSPARIRQVAIGVRPSTLLVFHQASRHTPERAFGEGTISSRPTSRCSPTTASRFGALSSVRNRRRCDLDAVHLTTVAGMQPSRPGGRFGFSAYRRWNRSRRILIGSIRVRSTQSPWL